ncbi:DUF6056 family protein [Dysgonomonas sp. 25]|uniref:DUF3329 domain-containing protein n=1 Tax=Dysgonomonas sp. 25 TaxID=2302933 RepID=UPI0013D2868F|nr:DUF6056 family protein [Dysgonomonas sp. 25]NDV67949.1 hypothetical protein [Dysgonomonas sp. 25]
MKNRYIAEVANSRKWVLYLCVFACFVSLFMLNSLFPIFTDDWVYTFIFRSDPPVRITGIREIIDSQYNHYFTWGGRFVVHLIAQFLLMLKPWMHDSLNALAFTLLLWLIYRISNYNNPISPIVFVFIYFLVYFFQPAFAATILWITGSANYLWGTLIILLFIYPYYLFFRNPGYKLKGIMVAIGFFIGGILAGWTNENMAVAVLLMLVFMCFYFRRRGELPRWAVVGLIGFSIGCVLLLAAPGNYVRMEVASANAQPVTIADTLISRLYTMFYHYLYYGLPLIPIYIIGLVALLKSKQTTREERRMILFISAVFVITAHIAFAVMIASPQFPSRALFGVVTFAIIAIGILYANIRIASPSAKVLKVSGMILLIGILGYKYYQQYNALSYANEQWEKRYTYVLQQKVQGNLHIELTEKIITAPEYHLHELSTDSAIWYNKAFAKYMGVKSVKVTE